MHQEDIIQHENERITNVIDKVGSMAPKYIRAQVMKDLNEQRNEFEDKKDSAREYKSHIMNNQLELDKIKRLRKFMK